MKDFPNGFKNWAETHFEVCSFMANPELESPLIEKCREKEGQTGVWDLSIKLTDEFEYYHINRVWDGEYYEEIHSYLKRRLEKQ